MTEPGPGPTTGDDAPDRRDRQPLILALIGLLAAVLLFAAAAIPVLRDGDSDDGGDGAAPPPTSTTTIVSSTDQATSAPVDTTVAASDPTTTVSAETTVAATDRTTTTVAPTTTTTVAPTTTTTTTTIVSPTTTTAPAADEVPESRAVVRNGQIVLEGAVPDEESAQRIVELASQILGPDNVVNNYVIDSRAGDPNLGNVRVDDTILFEPDTATIAPEFEPLLNQALALMLLRPSVTLHVVGHTDSVGSEEYNQRLSERRAEAVVQWLTDRGIDPARLSSEGKGESEPIADNETAEGRTLNRRIQVFIANLLADS